VRTIFVEQNRGLPHENAVAQTQTHTHIRGRETKKQRPPECLINATLPEFSPRRTLAQQPMYQPPQQRLRTTATTPALMQRSPPSDTVDSEKEEGECEDDVCVQVQSTNPSGIQQLNTVTGRGRGRETASGMCVDEEDAEADQLLLLNRPYPLTPPSSSTSTAIQYVDNPDRQQWSSRSHGRHASYPPASRHKKCVMTRRSHLLVCLNRLPDDARENYHAWIRHRHDSIENYLRMRCLSVRSKQDISNILDRMDEQYIQHVISLWHKTDGICPITGRRMVWKHDEVRRNPELAPTPVVTGGPGGANQAYEIGNVDLVCNDVAAFIRNHGGVEPAKEIALIAEKFIVFKNAHRTTSSLDALHGEWDTERHRDSGEVVWAGLSQVETERLRIRFSKNRTGAATDQQNDQEAHTLAVHSVQLLTLQRGRCAITGVQFDLHNNDNIRRKPSIDRIDVTRKHAPGNVHLTTRVINTTRGSMSVEKFEEVLVLMAKHWRSDRQQDVVQ